MKKEKLCGIYCIENIITGKKYIGQSVDIKKRWGIHLNGLRLNNHVNKHLQSAFNKYGEENFEFNILLICERFELTRYEQFFVDYYTPELLYNICIECVDSTAGVYHTIETRKKMSEECIKNGQNKGENNPMYGKQHTIESKLKMSENSSGESHPMYGKHHSDETRLKMSIAATGRIFSKETRIKMSISKQGRIISDETKEKMSNSKIGENNSFYGKAHTDESKIKMSKAQCGEKGPNSKLTENDVLEIKRLLKENILSQISIAKLYNVSCAAVYDIKRRKTWKYLQDEEEVQDE